MKFIHLSALATGAIAAGGLPSLDDAFSDIPSCSYAALASAMNKEGCSTNSVSASTMNCLCTSLYDVGYDVGYASGSGTGINSQCLSEFVQTLGTACGIYLSDETSSEIPAAVKVLASEVGGSAAAAATTSATAGRASLSSQVTFSPPSLTGLSTSLPAATTAANSLDAGILGTTAGTSPGGPATTATMTQTTSSHSPNAAGARATLGVLAPVVAVGAMLL